MKYPYDTVAKGKSFRVPASKSPNLDHVVAGYGNRTRAPKKFVAKKTANGHTVRRIK